MGDDTVRVEVLGLKELQSALRAVDQDLPKGLRDAMKEIATHVVGEAQQRMPFRTGEAAKSIKPRASQRGAAIAFPSGGAPWQGVKADYYPWLDFGGTTGKGHVANGHNGSGGSVKRPIIKGGRYIYPAIADSKEYIAEEVDKAIKRIAESQNFETREGI